MNAIGKKGKKRKKVVYVKQGGRKKSIVPLLLGGGLLAYFLFFKKTSTATTTIIPTGTNTAPPADLPPAVTYQTPQYQPTDPQYGYLIKSLVDKRQQLYSALAYGNYPPSWIEAFQEMKQQGGPAYVAPDQEDATRVRAAIAELQAANDYINRYWSVDTPLTSNDQPLYSQVVALRNKYGMFK